MKRLLQRFRFVRSLLVLAYLALLTTVGCVSTRHIGVGESVQLGPNEGILVVHVSSNVEVASARFGSGVIENLSEGHHIELYVVSAGKHRWSEIRVANSGQPRFRPPRDEDLVFRVVPGRINYVGLLDLHLLRSGRLWYRTIDRSAIAIGILEKQHPEILREHPTVYSGRGQSVFLAKYQQARARASPDPVSDPIAVKAGEPRP